MYNLAKILVLYQSAILYKKIIKQKKITEFLHKIYQKLLYPIYVDSSENEINTINLQTGSNSLAVYKYNSLKRKQF